MPLTVLDDRLAKIDLDFNLALVDLQMAVLKFLFHLVKNGGRIRTN